MASLSPREDELIPYSIKKSLYSSWIPLYMFLIGGTAGLMFLASFVGLFIRLDVDWLLGGFGIIAGGLICLMAFYVGVAYSWATIKSLLNKQRIVLKENRFQILIGENEIIDEIPYDNLKRVFVYEHRYEDRTVNSMFFVAIELHDEFKKGTIISKISPMKIARDWEGPREVNLIIRDHYDIKPSKLCSKLERRRKEALENRPKPKIESVPLVENDTPEDVFGISGEPPELPRDKTY